MEQKTKRRETAAKAATATLSAALEALTAPHAPAALLTATALTVCANAARCDGISVVPAAVAPWADHAQAVLAMFLGGQETGNGWADVLTGAVNPSGKLPVTFVNEDRDAKRVPHRYEPRRRASTRAPAAKL